MGTGDSPRFFDKSATVLKPEGAPMADNLAEAILIKELLQPRNLPADAVGRPLERDTASAFYYNLS